MHSIVMEQQVAEELLRLACFQPRSRLPINLDAEPPEESDVDSRHVPHPRCRAYHYVAREVSAGETAKRVCPRSGGRSGATANGRVGAVRGRRQPMDESTHRSSG